MRLFKSIAIFAVLLGMPARGYAQCEAYWLDLAGSGEQEYLTLRSGWPIAQFLNNFPSWRPALFDAAGRYARPTSKSDVRWEDIPIPAVVEPIGRAGGRSVSAITYTPASRVIVWDRGKSSWCPVAILDGGETMFGAFAKPEVFTWRGKDIVSQRILYAGMGGLQNSLFFAMVNGTLRHLRQDDHAAQKFIESNEIKLSHRGGRFCRSALTWETQAWKEDAPTEGGTLRISYKVDGNRLIVESTSFVTDTAGKDCGQYSR